ncbi:MAG: ABC transporter permease [Actinobacteria bacterium]|nr:ABC transporter permease [Actinomycetota bacterium]
MPPSLRGYFADLWAHRDFLLTVPLGELRAQNQNSALGNAWHLLNPLLLAGVYYLVFGIILQASRGVDYYPAFLIIGIMTYSFVGKVVQAGARTVVSNLKLIQSIRFPRASLPLAATISETIAHGPALLTMFGLVWLTSLAEADLPPIGPSWGWLLVFPATALMAIFGLGLALITARATFHFRDVQQVLPYVLRIWMYLSGMFYPLSFVSERAGDRTWMVWLFQANPLWQFFRIFREALIEGRATPWVWGAATAWSVAVVVLGFLYFRANEAEYGRA